MIDRVRGKFFVIGIEKAPYVGAQPVIKFGAVSKNISEDTENNYFNEATPSGEIRMVITNKAVADFFQLGKAFYVDFS